MKSVLSRKGGPLYGKRIHKTRWEDVRAGLSAKPNLEATLPSSDLSLSPTLLAAQPRSSCDPLLTLFA